MTLHYHGTPITPLTALHDLAGGCFCVSYARPEQVIHAHRIGQSVLLDNGAFSFWRKGTPTDWPGYYAWSDRWLDYPTTWAVIPDVINGTDAENDALLLQWPHGLRGAPVWHLHEPLERMLHLLDAWPRICFGSSDVYADVLSAAWCRRMDDAWNAIINRHRRTPFVHMLRGLQLCVKGDYPFASLDSTDIAQNHKRPQNTPTGMARRWDREQCPPVWLPRAQFLLEGGACGRAEAAQ